MRPRTVSLLGIVAAALLAFAAVQRFQYVRLRAAADAARAAEIKDRLAAGRLAARHRKSQAWRTAGQQDRWAEDTLDGVAALKSALQALPRQRIPELAFLTDEDWVVEATHLPAEPSADDLRACLDWLQNRAKEAFAQSAQQALNQYLRTTGGVLPKQLGELAPYLAGRYDPALESRYELKRDGSINLESPRDGAGQLIAPILPAQADDFGQARFEFGRSGLAQSWIGPTFAKVEIPSTLSPQAQRDLAAAYLAYLRSHDGALPASAEMLKP